LDRGRPEYSPHVFAENVWLEARQRQPKDVFDRGYVTRVLADNFGNGLSSFFPLLVKDPSPMHAHEPPRPNLSEKAACYIASAGSDPTALFFSTVAILHAPAYRRENQGGLKQDWPRIPLPATKELLLASAALGQELAALLDPESPMPTSAASLTSIGPISAAEGTLDPDTGDLEVTAGWGHAGQGGVTMPARGRITERPMTPAELAALPPDAAEILGETTCDVWLNGRAYWRNIPKNVWEYTLGGYQVIKKWLSYREHGLLGRSLSVEEARYITGVARRIAAILLMGQQLNASYSAVKGNAIDWKKLAKR
jgi:hypothetical protein